MVFVETGAASTLGFLSLVVCENFVYFVVLAMQRYIVLWHDISTHTNTHTLILWLSATANRAAASCYSDPI